MANRPQFFDPLPDYSITQLPDSRSASAIGREARLELIFERRGGRTILAHAYVEPPLRIGRAFDVDGAAYVILVCAGPGLFSGDCLRQHVTVGRGARALLVSQSALQVHPANGEGSATVQSEYHVAGDAELHCHWDPVIPFAGARLVQRVDLRLAADSRFYWSDALMSGRLTRGESWRFESIDHELRLSVAGLLKYLERYRLLPGERRPQRRWMAGAPAYLGTAIVHHDAVTSEVAESLHRELSQRQNLTAGVDLVEARLMVGRFLAAQGTAFATARTLFRDRAIDLVFGNPLLVVRR